MATTHAPTQQGPGTQVTAHNAAAGTPVDPNTDASKSAHDIIVGTLDGFHLGSLGQWAWDKYLAGESVDQIMLELRQTTEYKNQYPAMAELSARSAGITEAQYNDTITQYTSLLQQYGMPTSIWSTRDSFTKWLLGGVTPGVLDKRLAAAQSVAVGNAPAEVRNNLNNFYGIEDGVGALTSFYLNPEVTENDLTQKITAAQIASQATLTKFGQITRDDAERLVSLGVNSQTAQQGFSQLANLGDVAHVVLAGEAPLSQDTMLAAAFAGDADAQRAIKERQQKRVGEFNQVGGFTQLQGGATGIGAARSA